MFIIMGNFHDFGKIQFRLSRYILGRLHLNCHKIGRLEIFQNNEYGVKSLQHMYASSVFMHATQFQT